MTDKQKEDIRRFLARPGMWIRDVEQDQVVAFIAGVRLGDRTLDLDSRSTSLLTTHYKVELTATGWPGQVQRFASQNGLTWFDGFRQVMERLLNEV